MLDNERWLTLNQIADMIDRSYASVFNSMKGLLKFNQVTMRFMISEYKYGKNKVMVYKLK